MNSPEVADSPPGREQRQEQQPKHRPRRIVLCIVVAVVALAADVVSKLLVVANLPEGKQVRLLGGALYLDQARNSGAAFSVATGFTIALTVIAVTVVVVIARQLARLRSRAWAVSLGLILGGAMGNLVDRLFRAPGVGRGHVVDWISVFGPDGERWPIFNIADSAVVCGAVIAAVLAVRNIDLGGDRRARD